MKSLIVLVVGLLSVGCGNSAEKKVVGEYEYKDEDGDTRKWAFLDNGIVERHSDGKKQREFKWSIVDGEIHIIDENGNIGVLRINAHAAGKSPKSITRIASIDRDGKRTDMPKEFQQTYKKIN